MADEFNPKSGPVVPFVFHKTNLTTGEANADLLAQDGIGTLAIMPKAGSVVGITLNASGAITAGTITASAHASSTEYANTPAPVASSAAQSSYAVTRPRNIRFAAGDKLGVSVSTTTTLDPTNTEDVTAYLFVVFDPD